MKTAKLIHLEKVIIDRLKIDAEFEGRTLKAHIEHILITYANEKAKHSDYEILLEFMEVFSNDKLTNEEKIKEAEKIGSKVIPAKTIEDLYKHK